MSRFILSPLASRDLDEIWEYIAADNIDLRPIEVVRIVSAYRDVSRLL